MLSEIVLVNFKFGIYLPVIFLPCIRIPGRGGGYSHTSGI